MLPTIEIFKILIMYATLANAAPNKPTYFDEYKAFLDTPHAEVEEPCEVSMDSSNPLLRSWWQRNCK